MQQLWIGELLAHLFNTAMNVSTMRAQVFYLFSFETNFITQYTMCAGMLRSHVNDVFGLTFVPFPWNTNIFQFNIEKCFFHLMFYGKRIFIIFSQWIANPIVIEENSSQVRM